MAWGCSTREVFLEEVDFELGFTGSMLLLQGRSSEMTFSVERMLSSKAQE